VLGRGKKKTNRIGGVDVSVKKYVLFRRDQSERKGIRKFTGELVFKTMEKPEKEPSVIREVTQETKEGYTRISKQHNKEEKGKGKKMRVK